MAWKLGSPTPSRLGVSCDLEIENKATITGLRLGQVAEMNLVGSRTGGGDESGGNRTGGGYMLQVNSERDGGGYVVVYMDSDWWSICGGEYGSDDEVGVVVVYGSGDVITCEQNSKL